MAAASPVRAAACSGVVAPRGKESVAAGLLLWAVFFLNERFLGAIGIALLLSRCQSAVLFCNAGRLHTCVDSVNDVFQ